MQKPDHKAGILKREGLDIRAFGPVEKGVHLRGWDSWIGLDKIEIILIFTAIVVYRIFPFLKLFPGFHGDLSAQGEVVNAKLLEDTAFDVGVK